MLVRYLPLKSMISQNFKAARGKEGTESIFMSTVHFLNVYVHTNLCKNYFLAQVEKMRRLQDVFDKIEEVVLASQGLQQVISTIKELSELSTQTAVRTLTENQMEKIKAAFTCIVCKGKGLPSLYK